MAALAFPAVTQPSIPESIVPGLQNARIRRRPEAAMAKKQEAALRPKSFPSHGDYTVDEEGDRGYWTKVGAAGPHQDGEGFNITFLALPISVRLAIRTRRRSSNMLLTHELRTPSGTTPTCPRSTNKITTPS
jgi:hypothetical protein